MGDHHGMIRGRSSLKDQRPILVELRSYVVTREIGVRFSSVSPHLYFKKKFESPIVESHDSKQLVFHKYKGGSDAINI